MLLRSTVPLMQFVLYTGRPCKSSKSTFAAVFEANPVTNSVRPATCKERLLGALNCLMDCPGSSAVESLEVESFAVESLTVESAFAESFGGS